MRRSGRKDKKEVIKKKGGAENLTNPVACDTMNKKNKGVVCPVARLSGVKSS